MLQQMLNSLLFFIALLFKFYTHLVLYVGFFLYPYSQVSGRDKPSSIYPHLSLYCLSHLKASELERYLVCSLHLYLGLITLLVFLVLCYSLYFLLCQLFLVSCFWTPPFSASTSHLKTKCYIIFSNPDAYLLSLIKDPLL